MVANRSGSSAAGGAYCGAFPTAGNRSYDGSDDGGAADDLKVFLATRFGGNHGVTGLGDIALFAAHDLR